MKSEIQPEDLPACECGSETRGHQVVQQLIIEDERDGHPWGEGNPIGDRHNDLQSTFSAAYPVSDIQSKDPTLKHVRNWLTTGNPPPAETLVDAQLRCYKHWWMLS